MTDRELLQEALDALTYVGDKDIYSDTIDALRARLAQPEQEPVAWMYVNFDGECEQIEHGTPFDDPSVTPLYTAPPQRGWVGLTDKDIEDCLEMSIQGTCRAIEAKLKEKNT